MLKTKPLRTGNAASLVEHKARSVKATREQLEIALARILEGKPKRVQPGTTNSAADKLLEAKRGELSLTQARAREYRNIAENLHAEMEAVARNNYALSHRMQELEDLLRRRDAVIADLQERVGDSGKGVRVHPAVTQPEQKAALTSRPTSI